MHFVLRPYFTPSSVILEENQGAYSPGVGGQTDSRYAAPSARRWARCPGFVTLGDSFTCLSSGLDVPRGLA